MNPVAKVNNDTQDVPDQSIEFGLWIQAPKDDNYEDDRNDGQDGESGNLEAGFSNGVALSLA